MQINDPPRKWAVSASKELALFSVEAETEEEAIEKFFAVWDTVDVYPTALEEPHTIDAIIEANKILTKSGEELSKNPGIHGLYTEGELNEEEVCKNIVRETYPGVTPKWHQWFPGLAKYVQATKQYIWRKDKNYDGIYHDDGHK